MEPREEDAARRLPGCGNDTHVSRFNGQTWTFRNSDSLRSSIRLSVDTATIYVAAASALLSESRKFMFRDHHPDSPTVPSSGYMINGRGKGTP